ncbi:hypothetical protein HDV02_005221, partial [Globomyces sp. JEL0801]
MSQGGCPVVKTMGTSEGSFQDLNNAEAGESGCPVINRTVSEEKVAPADQVFMAHANDSIKQVFDGLRKQTLTIEQSIETGEQDVL